MNIPPIKREWNVNTIISVIGLLTTVFGGVYAYSQITAQVGFTAQEFANYRVATDARLAALEAGSRRIDALEFRVSANEIDNAAMVKGMSDLQSAVAQQSGDIRVMREILQRIERQASPANFTPLATLN